jgi:hypothetical protein
MKKQVDTIRLLPEVDRAFLDSLSHNKLIEVVQSLSDYYQMAVMSARLEGKGISDVVADFNRPGGAASIYVGANRE